LASCANGVCCWASTGLGEDEGSLLVGLELLLGGTTAAAAAAAALPSAGRPLDHQGTGG